MTEQYLKYNSQGMSIQDLFGRTEQGFLVPRYQRKYTWEDDNIEHLFDDLVLGVRELIQREEDDATTFLGTAIFTPLDDKSDTVPLGEQDAEPTGVLQVIDGQQRIATIALLGIRLRERLRALNDSLPNGPAYDVLSNHCRDLMETLAKLYAINLRRGSLPPQKPKVIRSQDDRWTYKGDDTSYSSPVAAYIATYIRTESSESAFAAVDPELGARVRGNVRLLDEWIEAVCTAHLATSDLFGQFPVGRCLATARMQRNVLGFEKREVRDVVQAAEAKAEEASDSAIGMFHLFVLSHYLLRRCGVNYLEPTNQDAGFDMFQALNTTGTPLTALETLLPIVMKAEETGGRWEETPSSDHMADVERLFDTTTTNEQKTGRTNELLRTFALCYEGKKLGNKFSAQRRWLKRVYEEELPTIGKKRAWLADLARVASFYYGPWFREELSRPGRAERLEEHPEADLVGMLVRYLRDANSKLSAPVLARFYADVRADGGGLDEFVEAAKACAAFFTLWRSARSTAGLDEVYRRFFAGSRSPGVSSGHSWKRGGAPVSGKALREYFCRVLEREQIWGREEWIKASSLLRYTEHRIVCRFMLFLAGHDRVGDPESPGLTTSGTRGSCSLLSFRKWEGSDYKSLEHVAPRSRREDSEWDSRIYLEEKAHDIGNLLLLPTTINSLAANKEWAVKYLHYSHVGLRSEKELAGLRRAAKRKGVVLGKRAIAMLRKTEHKCAVEPILCLGEEGPWDADLVDRRTRQIKEIGWERLSSWLGSP